MTSVQLIFALLAVAAFFVDVPVQVAKPSAHDFRDARLTVTAGEKFTEVDATLRFTDDRLEFVNPKTQQAHRTFSYAECKSAEYSYSKSPRWKTAIFVSPFLFLSQGKKHWFLVKTASDYALVRLDKGNYKLILAEFETRTGLKVEAEGENK